jgi:hypothetical protein
MTAEEWNAEMPVGTPVRFYPVAGEMKSRDTVTRSEAWTLGHGEAVVKIEGQAGGVSLDHLEVLVEGAPDLRDDRGRFLSPCCGKPSAWEPGDFRRCPCGNRWRP